MDYQEKVMENITLIYLLMILKDKEKDSTNTKEGNLFSYKSIKFYIDLHIVFCFSKAVILYLAVYLILRGEITT